MLDAVNKLARDGTVGVLVVTGSGRAFSVGLDLDWARSIVGPLWVGENKGKRYMTSLTG